MYSKFIFVTLSLLLILQPIRAMHKRSKATDITPEIPCSHMTKPVLPSQDLIDIRTGMEKTNDEWLGYMQNCVCLDACCVTLFGALVYLSNISAPQQ